MFGIRSSLSGKQQFDASTRRLLKALFIFSFLLPFFVLYSNAFVFNQAAGSLLPNIVYNAFLFVSIPMGFYLGGWLLRWLHIRMLFQIGMISVMGMMTGLVFLPPLHAGMLFISLFGLGSGLSNGLYWAGRNYLCMVCTHDDNRNAFTGLEYVYFILGGIIARFVAGNFIAWSQELMGLTRSQAYQSLSLLALGLSIWAAWIMQKGEYPSFREKRFFHFRYPLAWRKARLMAFFMGFFHGAYMILPTLLVMMYIGGEAALGITTALAQFVTLLAIYWVSQNSGPEDRSKILRAGWLCFGLAVLAFIGLLSSQALLASLILIAAFYVADPMVNFPYRASTMRIVDDVRTMEGRSQFVYMLDVEQSNAAGRLLGLGLFYFLYQSLPLSWSLPLYLIGVCLALGLVMPLAKQINQKWSSQGA